MKSPDQRHDEREPEEWLVQALEDAPVPAPSAALREKTRQSFLGSGASSTAGDSGASETVSMVSGLTLPAPCSTG